MKTAIVTGASRGIGRAVALGLADDGYEVALLARSNDELETLREEIHERRNGTAIAFPVDVSDPKKIKEVVTDLQSKWNSIDLLFNNAGAYGKGTADISEDDFDRIMKVNVYGPYYLLKELVPWFRKQKSGTIINLASIAGNIGFAGVGAYAASKFALRGLSESLHRELEPEGIRVTLISPSWVNTDMAAMAGGPVAPDKMIQPTDILNTIQYVCSAGPNVALREILVGCRADIQ